MKRTSQSQHPFGTIEGIALEFKNPNVPHYHGRIEPGRFTPFPKNPTICKFMIQIGRYEELGSGVRKVNFYLPHYAPGAGKPVFDDGDMFTVTVPITGEASQGATATGQVAEEVSLQRNILTESALDALAKSFNTATGQVTGQVATQVLQACQTPRKATDIQSLLGIKHRETFLNNYLNPLLASGWIERTIPDKPNSRLQKYRLTEKARKMLEKRT